LIDLRKYELSHSGTLLPLIREVNLMLKVAGLFGLGAMLAVAVSVPTGVDDILKKFLADLKASLEKPKPPEPVPVPEETEVIQDETVALAEGETLGLLEGGDEDQGQPIRTMDCLSRCVKVDGKDDHYTVCRPHVAAGQTDTLPPLPPPRSGPQCLPFAPMRIIKKTSPNCWVSDTQYCRYSPERTTGYSCSCRGRSGYFG
jgi:hypothetical protein